MKEIHKAYKFRFYPQEDLKILLAKTFGCSRFVYNKILELSEQHYQTKYLDQDKTQINPNYKHLTSTDRVNWIIQLKQENIWLSEVSSVALQQSVRHLNTAYDRFFKHHSAKPTFKKKINKNSLTINGKDSLRFDQDFIKNKKFYLPKYDKPLNIKWSQSFNHLHVSSVTISKEPSGKYFISFLVKESIQNKKTNLNPKISIDLGLKTHVKIYDGKTFQDQQLPNSIKDIDKKIRKQQRILSRREKSSKNRNKQRLIVARLHERKNHMIQDFYQKLSSKIINDNQELKIEDLGIKNLMKNRKLSHKIQQVAWGRFIHMLEYKAQWNERIITKANRYYPSSKLCHDCEKVYDGLKLSERQWTCPHCGAQHDRDENACLNLYDDDETSYLLLRKNRTNNKGKNRNHQKSSKPVGATVCGGNVRPKSSKKTVSEKTEAVSNEARIHVL